MKKGSEISPSASAVARRNFLKLGAGAGAGAVVTTLLNSGNVSAQGGMKGAGSIDLHTHWSPPAYTKLLANLTHGASGGTPNPLDYDLEKRMKWMDDHGVQTHVLTLDGGMPWQRVPSDIGATLASIVNDAAIDAHMKYPERFLGGIELSVREPQLCLKELDRVAGKPGMVAVHLPTSYEENFYLFEPAFSPVLARIEQLGYPILFHPLDGDINIYSRERLGDKVSNSANFNNTLGFPFENTLVAGRLIITSTLDKFPKLEFVLPHSGGILPYIAGRLDHELSVAQRFKTDKMIMDYIRRFHYDTLTYYPETLRFLIDLVGSDRVVIGTDNYAHMEVEYPNALVEQLKLPAADSELIFKGNAKRLLHL
jgi:aminocarboxymuconate-semialdehyde decarboxylase